MLQTGTWILAALLLQTPSLDSSSPKERLDAVDTMSLVGRTENVAPLAAALKKETKSDVRGAIVAGLGRIAVPEVIPVLTESLKTDLDKDVRLQVVDSLQRIYIRVDTQGPDQDRVQQSEERLRVARSSTRARSQGCFPGGECGTGGGDAEGLQPGSTRRGGTRPGIA